MLCVFCLIFLFNFSTWQFIFIHLGLIFIIQRRGDGEGSSFYSVTSPFLWSLSSFRSKRQPWERRASMSQSRSGHLHRWQGKVKCNCSVAMMPGCQEWLETQSRGGLLLFPENLPSVAFSPASNWRLAQSWELAVTQIHTGHFIMVYKFSQRPQLLRPSEKTQLSSSWACCYRL